MNRQIGLDSIKAAADDDFSYDINIKDLDICVSQGFTIRPAAWNWRLVDICFRNKNTTKWQHIPVDLFDKFITGKNSESTFDNYGLKLKQGSLKYEVSMSSAIDGTLYLKWDGNVDGIVQLRKQTSTINQLKKDIESKAKGQQANQRKLNAAQQGLARAQNLPSNDATKKAVRDRNIGIANNQIAQINKLITNGNENNMINKNYM